MNTDNNVTLFKLELVAYTCRVLYRLSESLHGMHVTVSQKLMPCGGQYAHAQIMSTSKMKFIAHSPQIIVALHCTLVLNSIGLSQDAQIRTVLSHSV